MKTKLGREITLGSDVEGGLYHNAKRMYIPATAFNTPYSKTERKHWENGIGSYHRDNILVEFQTPVVSDWHALMEAALVCNNALSKEYQGLDVRVVYAAVIPFKDPAMVQTDEAAEMGCEPDIDAYTGEEAVGPDAKAMGRTRVCSGHLHIGGVEDFSFEQKCLLIQWMDVLVGIPLSLNESENSSKAYQRREFYGQAGRFRVKPYGVEYRTPSNLWMMVAMEGYQVPDQSSNILLAVDLADKGINPEQFGIQAARVADAINGPKKHYDGWNEDWHSHLYRHKGNIMDVMEDIKAHV